MTRFALLCGLLLLTSGCGLADYEARMEQAQRRLKRYEYEAAVLDAPLTIPSQTDKEGMPLPPPNFFLRPPRGIAATTDNAEQPRARLFYSFKATGATAGGVSLVEVAFGDLSPEFPGEALRCFSASGKPTTKSHTIQPLGRDPLKFERTEFDDGQHYYSINLWRGPQEQIAVAYWARLSQKAAASSVIEASLETFATGETAIQLHDESRRSPLDVPRNR